MQIQDDETQAQDTTQDRTGEGVEVEEQIPPPDLFSQFRAEFEERLQVLTDAHEETKNRLDTREKKDRATTRAKRYKQHRDSAIPTSKPRGGNAKRTRFRFRNG